jgi:hypothetical protein
MKNWGIIKPNGASTVDYALADVDLINNINFFQVSEPTYLSDQAQTAVHIKCDIIENNHKYDEYFNTIYNSYKWDTRSKTKLM